MHRLSVTMGLLLLVFGASACKGKTKQKDSSETVRQLEDCKTSEEEKKQYIATLERRLADLEGQGGMVTVNIEGEAMSISGTGPSGVKGNADDAALYEAFVAALRRSRGSIQKCYQNALKNNAGLQGREVTLDIQVGYQTSGKVAGAQFSPRIDQGFDKCMKAVANRWTLPAMPNAVSFNYKQTLKPE